MGLNDTIKGAIRRKFPAVGLDDTLETAVKTMAKNDVSALVVKVEDEVVGIVTVTDVMHCLAKNASLGTTKVSSFLTSCEIITAKRSKAPCVQLDEDETVKAAIQIMCEAGVNHMLVSGAQNKALGLVSSLDILKFVAR